METVTLQALKDKKFDLSGLTKMQLRIHQVLYFAKKIVYTLGLLQLVVIISK